MVNLSDQIYLGGAHRASVTDGGKEWKQECKNKGYIGNGRNGNVIRVEIGDVFGFLVLCI